jgi:antagonist of KipI
VAPWTAQRLRKGQTLRMHATRSGARCYLCVSGGIDAPVVLGSRSTHVLSGLGGFNGRALLKGDVLRAGPPRQPPAQRVDASIIERIAPRRRLRVTAGPQADWFAPAAQRAFFETGYRVTEASDRMGLRLEGAAIEMAIRREMVTTGVPLGAIQVPGGGQPVIVFVDQQTTGGYPGIASVISADLPSVGQLRPRDEVEFEQVSLQAARSLLVEQEAWLESDELLQP